ncbi:MAG TPA: TRAP transporter substrate-binding protein DctP, partial [Pseudogracilibacillus sp.]|nr:TRAP transporter substrate-binding protein DctP [Pseudogracilibacillus sp.]
LLAISDLPSGYENAAVASQVVSELIEKYDMEGLKDFKIITSFATEPAHIQSQNPIATVEDLKGEQFRASGVLIPVTEVLGASPVGMAQSELPEALQTGIVNGYLSSREVLMDSKFADMVGYTTNYPLGINTFVAVMNKDTWESLPNDIQNIINDLNVEMTLYAGEYLDSHVRESIDWSKENHALEMIELTEDEKEQWDKKLVKLQEEYVEDVSDDGHPAEEYFNDLTELVEKYNNRSK